MYTACCPPLYPYTHAQFRHGPSGPAPVKALLVLLPFMVFGLAVLALLMWGGTRHGNRRELQAAEAALDRIEAKTDLYSDIDSPLATEVRTILRAHRIARAGRNTTP